MCYLGLETSIQSGPKLYFSVKSIPINTRFQYLTFQTEETNIGNSMKIHSGEFTAPISGLFSFSLIGEALEYSHVYLQKNNVDITSTTVSSGENISISSLMELQLGDQIKIRLQHGHGHHNDLYNFRSNFICRLLFKYSDLELNESDPDGVPNSGDY